MDSVRYPCGQKALCVDVGRNSTVGPKAPHEVRPTVQKGLGLGTTRGAPTIYATAPSDCKVGRQIDLRELVYLMNGTCLRIAYLISYSHCTTEKIFWQEDIS